MHPAFFILGGSCIINVEKLKNKDRNGREKNIFYVRYCSVFGFAI